MQVDPDVHVNKKKSFNMNIIKLKKSTNQYIYRYRNGSLV